MQISLSLALTQPRPVTGGGAPAPSTAGQPVGLLLILTKAS